MEWAIYPLILTLDDFIALFDCDRMTEYLPNKFEILIGLTA